MKTLRVGVLGAGGRGGLARHAHDPEKNSAVVACCDTREAVRAECRTWYGNDVLTTGSVAELLSADLDALFVCTPDFLHEEHACAALEAGVAVYLEKPMAITIEGCDRLLTTAARLGVRLFVGHNMRYMTIIRKLKQLVDDGAVGEVKSIWCRHFISYGGDAYFRDWHADRTKSTGLLLQKGAHDLDVIHWLAGAYSTRVAAFGNLGVYNRCERLPEGETGSAAFNAAHWPPLQQTGFSRVMDVEDQTVMTMELEGGILGAYLQCHFTPDCCRNYTVIGTEGRLENLGDGPESPIMLWNRRKDSYRLIGDEVHYGDPVDAGSHGGADPLIVEEFLHFVREGGATTATPQAARMAVAAGCLATASLRQGGVPREIPALPQI